MPTFLTSPKKTFAVLLLLAGLVTSPLRAVPVTISYEFDFVWNTFYPTEKVSGNFTLTVEPPPTTFTGYTSSNYTLDAFDFTVTGLGLEPAETNYVKMLFNGGKLTYFLVSDRADFHLSAIPPLKAGYVLGITAQDLLTGTGIAAGSSSYFSYYLTGRRGVDMVYTYDKNDIVKVANPVPSVPDHAGTLGLLGATLLGLAVLRRRYVK